MGLLSGWFWVDGVLGCCFIFLVGLLRLLCYVCTLFVGVVGIFVWCCLAIVFYNCCLVGWAFG